MKKVLIFTLILAMIFSISACGTKNANSKEKEDEGGQETISPEKQESNLSVKMSSHPYIHALPMVYADQNGILDELFEKWSFDVYANGPVQNEAIASGAWEVGTTGMGGLVGGAPAYNLKAIGFTTPDTLLIKVMVRGDSELAKMEPDEMGVRGKAEDWKGKTIFCATGTGCHLLLVAALEHLNLTTDDVNIVDTSVPNGYASFLAGEGDIVVLWDSFSYQYAQKGGVDIANCVDMGLVMPNIIVATEDAIKNNREAVVAFLKMYTDNSDKLTEDPTMAAEMLYDYQNAEGITTTLEDCQTGVKLRPFFSFEENLKMFTPDQNGQTEAEQIVIRFMDFLISQGKFTEADKEKMIGNQFVDYSIMQDVAKIR